MALTLKQQSGFSLIEVLISVVILSVGLLALAGFNGNLYKSVRYSNDRARAMASVQQLIDNYRAQDVTAFVSGQDPGSCNNADGSAQRTWTVSNVAGVSNLRNMSIYACWTDSTGKKQEISVSTEIILTAAVVTAAPTAAPTPAGTPAPCSASSYADGSSYAAGAIVKNLGRKYKCTVAGWCSIGGPYAPGAGWAWQNAWSDEGVCT